MKHILITVVWLAVLNCSLSARVWYITPSGAGDAPTIQAGIDSAAAGDTVLVAPGTFTDTTHIMVETEIRAVSVHLYKNIALVAEGTPANTTIGNFDSDIAVFATGVDSAAVIAGFTITTQTGWYGCVDAALSTPYTPRFGIKCDAASPTITGNDIFGNDYGISLTASPANVLDNDIHRSFIGCDLHSISDAVISGNTIFDCGILLMCSDSSPSIIGNDASNGCDGLYFDGTGIPYIADNHIHHLHGSSNQPPGVSVTCGATIEHNFFDALPVGVQIAGTYPETQIVRNNLFYLDYVAMQIYAADVLIENNTVDGSDGIGIWCRTGNIVRRNIITRTTIGIMCTEASQPTLECNDVFCPEGSNYCKDCPDQTGTNGNVSLDPEYCGIDDSGNYYLQSDSPCAPGNHPDAYACGLIGAFPVNCGPVDVKKKTLGGIKALYE